MERHCLESRDTGGYAANMPASRGSTPPVKYIPSAPLVHTRQASHSQSHSRRPARKTASR